MRSRIDLTGRMFGRLEVLRYNHTDRITGHAYWFCECSCGRQKVIRSDALRNNIAHSCGCLSAENTAERNSSRATHGMTGTPEYHAFQHARRRCTKTEDIGWKDYGGRGIRFLYKTFEEFISDVGHRPSENHSLDRKDNNGNYEPGNCRWATKEDQISNRREYLTLQTACCAECGSTKFTRKVASL